MNRRKIELLAPAGDFECFQAAINAGADAVYLGGAKFGARAYANNFSEEEIVKTIGIAHLFDKKIYLTVNTLIKEQEMKELVPYIKPLYEAGIDGVIVQDIGVLKELQKNFPDLELHASTQMTITGIYGAKFLKNFGISRIVPARELSLEEIKDIKRETGLEIETFIHGAMCYGYSGQCLFSSILGGRSGNRGRCAGPCRLPYKDDRKHTIYPLSLKDMYTLPLIPKLIEAGIDSFKIEGRMKSPEYVAGVTAMYRKYIDKYLDNPNKEFKISKKDEELLRNLYIRTDICNGYYEQHNDRKMVTISEPGYCGSSQDVLDNIRSSYIDNNLSIPVQGYVSLYAGKKSTYTLLNDQVSVTVEGDIVSEALNRPLEEEEIKKRLGKMGDTLFVLESLTVDTDNKSFMPVKQLNELRRNACLAFEKAILAEKRKKNKKNNLIEDFNNKNERKESLESKALYVSVMTKEQLNEVLKFSDVKGIYVSSDLVINEQEYCLEQIKKNKNVKYFMALPGILRKRSYKYLGKIESLLNGETFCGVLVKTIEELQWLIDVEYSGQIIADYSVYSWNKSSVGLLNRFFNRITLSLELNRKETLELGEEYNKEVLLYGRIPLMYSANCIKKTLDKCVYEKKAGVGNGFSWITDRYKNDFPIMQNCMHCYNVLYNTVPLSLHNHMEKLMTSEYGVYRLDFSLENSNDTYKIVEYYTDAINNRKKAEFPIKDFTNGHYKRGAE